MTKSRGINRPRKFWTARDLEILRRRYPDDDTRAIAKDLRRPISSIYQTAKKLGVSKSEAYLERKRAMEAERLTKSGVASRFPKGSTPANKGLRRPGWAPGRMKTTQFKKGARPHTWKPIGSERLCDGYLQRKMTDTGYAPCDWKPVHVMLWEHHNGKVPRGHTVKFKDGDRTNIVIENLELMSRQDLMKRNSYHYNYPKEIGELIQLRGAVQRQINRRVRNAKQD